MPTASADVPPPRRRQPRAEQGSVLLLFPAAILIVLVLGSLAVDTALVHLRQRELVDAADSAASDAASLAVDIDLYRRTGELRLDPARADRAVRAALAARGVLDDLTEPPHVRVVSAGVVEVVLSSRARHLLATIVPGSPAAVTIQARGQAELRIG